MAVATAFACLLLAAPAAAAPFTVTRFDDPPPGACAAGDCSLREAIRAANAASGADEISLGAGTYLLSLPGTNDDVALNGDLDVTDSLTLTGAGAGATAIDANGAVTGERVLDLDPVDDGIDPVIEIADLRLTGGRGSFGLAARLDYRAQVTMRSLAISGNSGSSYGGAAFLNDESTLTVLDSVIADNAISLGYGGAFYLNNDSSLTLERTRVEGNGSLDSGGAAYVNNQSHVTIRDSVISGNTSQSVGGALYLQNQSTTTIDHSTVSGNAAVADDPIASVERGGGIYIQNQAEVRLANTTVSGNRAGDEGGAVYIRHDPMARFDNVTITGNSADADASGDPPNAIFSEMLPAGSLTLSSVIVSANPTPAVPDCAGPELVSAGFNLLGNTEGCGIAPQPGDIFGAAGAPVDPQLGPLADNGGPSPTHLPARASPAIDAGVANGLGADQRGVGRPQDASDLANAADGSDIGAVELPVAVCGAVSALRIDGGPEADQLSGTEDVDPIFGAAGDDTIRGLGSGDCVAGEAGADDLDGGPGADRLKGASEKDRLNGRGGKDRLNGGPAADLLKGGGGKDRLKGGPGKDRLKAAGGKRDRVNCGGGKRDRAIVDADDKVSANCEKVKTRSQGKGR